MKTTALIPARLESKRFPNKLLKKINGTPIILKTYRAAVDTGHFENVYVVSGNDQILELIEAEGGKTFKSLKKHNSGTDRIAEAAIKINTDIIVNLQGDEPFVSKRAIGSLIKSFDDKNVKMASLMTKFKSFEELNNPPFPNQIFSDNLPYTLFHLGIHHMYVSYPGQKNLGKFLALGFSQTTDRIRGS